MSQNTDIALLLPTNEQAEQPRVFPDYLPVEDMLGAGNPGHAGKIKYTKRQIKVIDTRKAMALKLVSQGVPLIEVAKIARMRFETLQTLTTQEWQKASLDIKAFSGAFKQASAICASNAMGKVQDAPFRDLTNAATGFAARANDMDMLSQMGVLTSPESQAVTLEANQVTDTTPDRIRRLLFKARSQAVQSGPVQDPLVVSEQSKVSSTVTVQDVQDTTSDKA